MDLHNSQQNYLALSEQLMALQQLNEQLLNSGDIHIPKFQDIIMQESMSAPEYEVKISEKHPHNLVSNSKHRINNHNHRRETPFKPSTHLG